MKRIFYILILISFNLNAADFCSEFSYKSEKLVVRPSKSGALVSFKNYKSDFRCKKMKGVYECNGDDDSGQFRFDANKNTLMIKDISFGEPDGKSFQITKKDLKGKNCAK